MKIFPVAPKVNQMDIFTVPIIENEVSFTNNYSLIATIDHSGTLNKGHWWAFIKDLHLFSGYS